MNPNIEVILPELWAVNSQWIRQGWIKELTPVPGLKDSTNEYASLTDDGILILKKESDFYPVLRQIVPRIMQHTDQELQICNYTMNKQIMLDDYERMYLNVMQWEIKRREIRCEYLNNHPKSLIARIRYFIGKVGEKIGNHTKPDSII